MNTEATTEGKERWDFGRFRESFDAIAKQNGDTPFSDDEKSEVDLRDFYEMTAAKSIAEYAAETYEYLRGIM